ncbi:hypothetical protein SODALDRAFT_325441 [Sodiomyces alkalinus F11]|uniref:Double-strand-break repair protein rad21 n=1 Tax=Sodiomyces alkalinus (strain CBS 110278 / VKM F-3762 / F11) TaxID=1314773 RepID=A0A3N2PQS5_SODAK|nr:hypothetical protein SODALDRAFT_325441 [Sodiomyces alkalinus F11]ROT36862.1 hypothetical protein SODALDRAFT_325441 [Sodiomyces alkalinus F11]
MFYAGPLVQKTGPLARVWLSANLEKRLSKTHILQSNLQDSVEAIITPTQAPMALRLSGQLLLGVVRIYSRKARYLLDDCNEASMKIKMAFRSSDDHDIPEGNLQVHNREALTLPDKITPLDNLDLPPPPDAAWLLSQIDEVSSTPMGRKGRVSNRDINLQEDFNNSQYLQDSTQMDDDLALEPMEDIELELDFGMDLDDDDERPTAVDVEMGREAPEARPIEDDMISELDMLPQQKDPQGRGREESLALDVHGDGIRIADEEGDIPMGMGDDDFQFNPDDDQTALAGLATAVPDMSRARISESPLSDIDEETTRRLDEEVSRWQNADLYEPSEQGDPSAARHPQRAKKRKLLLPDDQTMLASNHIKEQQTNRDNILKPQVFLPRDPFVLALMEMQKNGGFVANVMLDGRSAAWAPELRGMLSFEATRASDLKKRKRDSGIADMDGGGTPKSPRLEIGEEDEFAVEGGANNLGDQSVAGGDSTVHEIPADDGGMGLQMDDDDHHTAERDGSSMAPFDETTAPIVHPQDSGPVSHATKHAVHVLRDLFGPEAETDDEKRKTSSVLFQDLLPEERTTKADATKMFFECLVLATKDAIKVEQGESMGAPIRIRGKRGLWGAWAEREAGGEIAGQEEEENAEAEPQPQVQRNHASALHVAVEA